MRSFLPIVAFVYLLSGPVAALAQGASPALVPPGAIPPAPMAVPEPALAAPEPAADSGGPVVGAIEVEGSRRVEVDAIKAAMKTKVGASVDAKSIQADVRAVMKLGYFADVSIEEKGSPDRPTLVVKVVEKPSVQDYKIEGNDELSADDLKDTIEVKRFAILDLTTVRKTVKKIQEKYNEKGFYLAEVNFRIEDRPDNQVIVVFEVNERAKVEVRRIHFVGNDNISKEEIVPFMQTQEGSFLGFLSSAGTYKEEAFQRDLQAVQAVYLERGYVGVKVGKPTVALSPDRTGLFISIPIEEGEQYTIGKLDFSGELLGMRPFLPQLLQSSEGQLFVRSKVGHDIFAVADFFKDMGYAYVNVNPVTALDPKKRTMGLTFDVQPGQKVFFERIEITGNQKTRDKVVRRELRIYEGDLYSAAAIKISKQRITALGYFETVEITTKKGSAEDRIVAIVEVKEKATGTFQIGAGFSSYENFILTAQISQNNFFGWGQTLSLQVQWSSLRQLGQIQFMEPYFLDSKWTFAFDVYANENLYLNFTRGAIGGSLTWGYELAGLSWFWPSLSKLEDLRLFFTYTLEKVRVTSSVQDLLLYNRFRSGWSSVARTSVAWDRRDNRLFPTRGFYLSASLDLAPPMLAPAAIFGDQVNLFYRETIEFRFYQEIWQGLTGRFRLLAGVIRGWNENNPVPVSELYYVGGVNTVRGYRLYTLSPVAAVGASTNPDASLRALQVGGNKQIVLNFELEYPIVEKMGIRAVVFFDMGNALAPGVYIDPNVPWGLYKSIGFGFRWFSPIGPLRFEWGFPLNRRTDPITGAILDAPVDFQFTIGSFF
ncbi:MAG: outer membrane protein assembly factor BamA [Deltaproteobacteria bacterium]